MLKYQCLILAAGIGKRSNLKKDKLLFKKNNETIIEKCVFPFLTDLNCEKIIIVSNSNNLKTFQNMFSNKKINYCLGGLTRQESVKKGLKMINSDYVLIHDGARPNVTQELINRVLEGLKTHDCVIPVITLKDSIKEVKDKKVVCSLNRENYRLIQTPQGFKTTKIKLAHELAKINSFSDDSILIEQYLHEDIYCVDGDYLNIKYTYQSDFGD